LRKLQLNWLRQHPQRSGALSSATNLALETTAAAAGQVRALLRGTQWI
jgi:hypothetical protein